MHAGGRAWEMCAAPPPPTHLHTVGVVDLAQDGNLSPEVTQRNLIRALEHLGCHIAAMPLGLVYLTKLTTTCRAAHIQDSR
jgi:hypothetical protein